MKGLVSIALAIGGLGLGAASAATEPSGSLGGFPIREPGAKAAGTVHDGSKKKGVEQIVVDANGRGPYKTISKAVADIAEGGTIYVMHGEYNESIALTKSVVIQGDRGPGEGVRVNAPRDSACLSFAPKEENAHAMIANVSFAAAGLKSSAAPCIDVALGSFTLRESDVLGSVLAPAVRISGGDVRLEKNTITGGKQGVAIAQNHALSQTYIINNRISGNDIGIDIAKETRADVYITDNEVFDNLQMGIQAAGYGAANLTGNKIRHNKGLGVFLDSRSKLSYVRYNEIVANDGDGIAIPFGNNGIIEDNTIAGNDGFGVFCRSGFGPEPKIDHSNVITDNKSDKPRSKKQRSICAPAPKAKSTEERSTRKFDRAYQ